jgi:hypothetical protein
MASAETPNEERYRKALVAAAKGHWSLVYKLVPELEKWEREK